MSFDWALGLHISACVPVQPSSELKSVGIWLWPLGNAAYVAYTSSLPGVDPSGLVVRVSDYYLDSLGFEAQLDHRIFSVDLFLIFLACYQYSKSTVTQKIKIKKQGPSDF